MNRKFFINGLIVRRLLSLLDITPIELASRLGKTQQAVSQIQKRDFIKENDADKILKALGLTIEEVEEMDLKGVFANKNSAETITPSLIDQPENNYLKETLQRIELHFKEETERHKEEVAFYREQLKNKDKQIEFMEKNFGKKFRPVTNNPDVLCKIVQLNKIDDYNDSPMILLEA